MNEQPIEEMIKNTINRFGGIKRDELLYKLYEYDYSTSVQVLDQLVTQGEIIEIQFVIPDYFGNPRTAFYLPKNTKLNVLVN